MAIVKLRSNNPNFSHVIQKNPATGMLLREIRQGMGFGWYSDNNTYNVLFRDAENEVSYKSHPDESFEYLNTTRYTSPLAVLNMLTEFFDTAIKKPHATDVAGYKLELFVPLIQIEHERYIRFFQQNFEGFTLEVEHKVAKTYTLRIRTEKRMQDLLNYANLFCLFLALFVSEYMDLSNEVIKKYLGIMNTLDAPFYIRYLFGRNVLNSRDRFLKYKTDLENTKHHVLDMKYGNTAIQRRDVIRSLLKNDKSILDIGCGEGFYAIPFSRNIPDYAYYAVDVDEEMVRIVSEKAKKSDIENLVTYNSIEAFLDNYGEEKLDIILTEVVEHMQVDQSAQLLRQIADNIDFDKLIVTTPNAEFNPFYALEGFRHDDHKWEMTTEQFTAWISSLFGDGYNLTFFGVGDQVDGIHTTQGVLIQKI